MDIILIIMAVFVSELVIVMIRSAVRFNRDVTKLFFLSKDISKRTFHYDQLVGLPDPVQRYFRRVLRDGQPYISYVRLLHNGQFRTTLKGNWTQITGEEYFTTATPGFIWRGKTRNFTAIDRYMEKKGLLKVYFLSLFRILKGQGPFYNKSELQRWVAESVLFPTSLLPDDRLTWDPIDANTAILSFTHDDLQFFFRVRFNASGEIAEMETKRYMGAGRTETWITQMENYREYNGVLIPSSFRAKWRLKECESCYAQFELQRIEYNNPEGTDSSFEDDASSGHTVPAPYHDQVRSAPKAISW